jgi:hypothetical protein
MVLIFRITIEGKDRDRKELLVVLEDSRIFAEKKIVEGNS